MDFSFPIATNESSHTDYGITIEEISEFELEADNENVEDTTCEEIEMETDQHGGCNVIVEGQIQEMPYVGQQFASEKNAYDAYNAYALSKGFGLRLGKTAISQKTKALMRREIYCKKAGKKTIRETNFDGKIIENRRRDTRTECKAKMVIGLNQTTGVWSITSYNDEHNHELTTPSKSMKHRSHKQLHRRASTKRLIDTLHDEGMGPSEIAKVVNVHTAVGGEVERITPQQCHDQSRKYRRNNLGNECVSILNHFMELRNKDPLFFFAMELDDDRSLRSLFWADGRSISSYLEFSDVVVFDVTYRTNRFAMPFAPFTGVNHHRQSTLFGCALLTDETETTFVWLFEQWLKCMCGRAPGVIITDQDQAIGNAIKKVFPITRHRYCQWHLDKHVTQHLAHQISNYEGFWKDYQEWYWSESVAESESRWVVLRDKYGLQSNDWMMKMYKLRCHWVPAYWRDVFTAGMRTSQRSESMNAFFDGFVNAFTPLNEFVLQYDKALVARRLAESNEDFKTIDSRPNIDAGLPMEFQAANCYTRSMYERFRQEYSVINLYGKSKVSINGGQTVYEVWNQTITSAKRRLVVYDVSDTGVTFCCSCAKFETEGMLCRHIFHIMVRKQVNTIPEQYILKRWTIDARYRGSGFDASVLDSNACSEQVDVTPLEQFSLRVKQNRMFEKASVSKVVYIEYDNWMDEKLTELEMQAKSLQLESGRGSNVMPPLCPLPPVLSQGFHGMPEIQIRDPSRVVSTKGRPAKPSRIASGIELSKQQKEKKKVTCSFCSGVGHNKTGCHLRKGGYAAPVVQNAETSGYADISQPEDPHFVGYIFTND